MVVHRRCKICHKPQEHGGICKICTIAYDIIPRTANMNNTSGNNYQKNRHQMAKEITLRRPERAIRLVKRRIKPKRIPRTEPPTNQDTSHTPAKVTKRMTKKLLKLGYSIKTIEQLLSGLIAPSEEVEQILNRGELNGQN